MTEWLRDGLEGRSLKATLRLYLLGLMLLAPAALVLALAFGGQVSLVATPLLVLILVAAEYAHTYLPKLRKEFEELLWKLSLRMMGYFSETNIGRPGMRVSIRSRLGIERTHFWFSREFREEENTFESLVDQVLYDEDSSVRASAAAALGLIDDLRAVEPLISALSDEDASVRSSATEALRRISTLPAAQAVNAREMIETIIRDQSEVVSVKNEDASTAAESVRKRA